MLSAPYVLCAALALAASIALVWPLLRAARLMAAVLSVFVAGGSMALYGALGAAERLPMIAAQRQEHAVLHARISDLRARNLAAPHDAVTLSALGAAWMEAGEIPRAVAAFREAVLQSGGEPDAIARFAAALVLQNEGVVSEEAAASIAMTLRLDPAHPVALRLDALRQQQRREAPVTPERPRTPR
jgi:cytochrome c-type biogenesis protein CcmH/NrfG